MRSRRVLIYCHEEHKMKNTINEIRSASPSYGSLPFWSWNDRLDESELRRQIRDMKRLGMSGFFMHARGGLETEYLSDEWFSCITACIDEAKKLGMEAWAYDENGWPSGFGGGALLKDRENLALAVEMKFGAYEEASDTVIAVYKKNPDGTFTHITRDIGEDEYLILYRRWDESYVDTLNPAVIDKFLEVTHEEYKKRIPTEDFGRGRAMPGFFTDEPQYYRWGNPYSDTLPEEFMQAYGYPIYDALPAIFFDFSGADKYRYDYYYLIHKLFTNNSIRKIYTWCEENGVMLTGHGIEETSLEGQMMCSGGVMPFYQYEHIPGVDYLCRPIADDISFKQIGSVCAQLGRKKVLSEMFACCGWDVSPTELKRIAEVQYASGVNLMCQHLYPYSERGQRKRDYPLHYSEHNPWQEKMADFDRYFANLGSTLSRGNEYAPILVIHPIHGAYCKYIKARGVGEIEDKFRDLSRTLSLHDVPYHYGDEWMISEMASVEGGRIRLGLCSYDAVIIPYTHSLDGTTVALLKEFAQEGGRIHLYDGIPPYVDGAPADGGLDWLRECATATFDDILALRDVVVTEDGESIRDVRTMSRVTSDGRIVFVTNVGTDAHYPVKVKLPRGRWARLDMDTLELCPVHAEDSGEHTTVTLALADAESVVLVSGDDIDLPCATIPAPIKRFIEIPSTVSLASPVTNMMTLDTAELSLDGVSFDEPLSVMGIKDNLLRRRYDGDVHLRFTFDLDYEPRDLKFVIEPMFDSVRVNGVEVHPSTDEYFFDRSFATAPIHNLVHRGRNEITVRVHHYQSDYVYHVLYGGVSESLRNCLVFDTEIENTYLIGDFAIKTDGKFTDGERCSTVYDGSFTLTVQSGTVPSGNVVHGGFPFYCGPMSLKFTYTCSAGDPTHLRLDGRFAVARIRVNGKDAGEMMFSRTLELAGQLIEGDNVIEVTITNSMRNLMGPHHRPDPEPHVVYPNLLSYEGEWNGRECEGYLPTYAFVKFGLKMG